MFTIADICNIAIQIEKNGEETYLNASKTVDDQHISEVLLWMAKEEAHHAQWFENLNANIKVSEEQRKIEAMGKSLLQDMVKGNSFLLGQGELEGAESVEAVISRSIELERDTILFYEFLLGFLEDEETIQQLKTIITEEQNHMKQLELLQTNSASTACEPLSY
jgi:rubrerythrin